MLQILRFEEFNIDWLRSLWTLFTLRRLGEVELAPEAPPPSSSTSTGLAGTSARSLSKWYLSFRTKTLVAGMSSKKIHHLPCRRSKWVHFCWSASFRWMCSHYQYHSVWQSIFSCLWKETWISALSFTFLSSPAHNKHTHNHAHGIANQNLTWSSCWAKHHTWVPIYKQIR